MKNTWKLITSNWHFDDTLISKLWWIILWDMSMAAVPDVGRWFRFRTCTLQIRGRPGGTTIHVLNESNESLSLLSLSLSLSLPHPPLSLSLSLSLSPPFYIFPVVRHSTFPPVCHSVFHPFLYLPVVRHSTFPSVCHSVFHPFLYLPVVIHSTFLSVCLSPSLSIFLYLPCSQSSVSGYVSIKTGVTSRVL